MSRDTAKTAPALRGYGKGRRTGAQVRAATNTARRAEDRAAIKAEIEHDRAPDRCRYVAT